MSQICSAMGAVKRLMAGILWQHGRLMKVAVLALWVNLNPSRNLLPYSNTWGCIGG